MKKLISALLVVLAVGTSGVCWVYAQEKNDPEKPGMSHRTARAHGGQVFMTERHHFELVFLETGLRVYPYDDKQQPFSAKDLTGKATFTRGSDKPADKALVYVPPNPDKGILRDYLEVQQPIVAKEDQGKLRIRLAVDGLKDGKEQKASFDLTFIALTPKSAFVCAKCNLRAQDPGQCPKCKTPLSRKDEAAPSIESPGTSRD